MKTRNIKHSDGKGESFAVSRHIILRNFWEYYVEEPNENGITFGFVMGFSVTATIKEKSPFFDLNSPVHGEKIAPGCRKSELFIGNLGLEAQTNPSLLVNICIVFEPVVMNIR